MKEQYLELDDIIPFGKYKGETVKKVLTWPDNLQRRRLRYLEWLFGETNLKAANSVRKLMQEIAYEFLLSDEKAREMNKSDGYSGEYSDMDIWVGVGDPSWQGEM